MQPKQPVVLDWSHWRTVPDISLVTPKPILVLTKATEGDYKTDPKFIEYFAGLKANNILRGAFHFHRKAIHPSVQASYFISTIAPYITSADILAVDVEEGGETAAQLITFLKMVRAAYANHMLIYSRKNLLDPIQSTLTEREYLKQFPIWTAGYPWFPDNYSTIPPGYIPDPLKWGPAAMWQYTDRLPVSGIVEGVSDANYIAPWFLEKIKPTTPPPSVRYPNRVDLIYDTETKSYVPE